MTNVQVSTLNAAKDEIYDLGFTGAVSGGISTQLAKQASAKIEREVKDFFSTCSDAEAKAYIESACRANRGWFNKLHRKAAGKAESDSVKAARRGQLQVGNIYLRALLSGMPEHDLVHAPLEIVLAKINFNSFPTLGQELFKGQVYSKNGPVFTWGKVMADLPENHRLFAIHYAGAKRHADEALFGQAFNGVLVLRPSMSGNTLSDLGARIDDTPGQGWDIVGTILISAKNEVLYSTGVVESVPLFTVNPKTGDEQRVPFAKATSCIGDSGMLADWNFPEKFIDRTPKGMNKVETKQAIDRLCKQNADRV